MYNMIGHPAWQPAVKFDSCNNLLSSFHTDCIILRQFVYKKNNINIIIIIIEIKRKYLIRFAHTHPHTQKHTYTHTHHLSNDQSSIYCAKQLRVTMVTAVLEEA